MCSYCNEELLKVYKYATINEQTKKIQISRLMGCRNCHLNKSNESTSPEDEKVTFVSRDANGARNMLKIANSILTNQEIPDAYLIEKYVKKNNTGLNEVVLNIEQNISNYFS